MNKRAGWNTFINLYPNLLSDLFPFDTYFDPEVRALIFSKEAKRLVTFIKEVQIQFLASLDQNILKLTRKFSHDRWRVYCFLKKNDHPYVLQLVDTCPALIAILSIADSWPTLSSTYLKDFEISCVVRKIQNGEKPKNILGYLINLIFKKDLQTLWREVRDLPQKRQNEIKDNWVWIALNAPACSGGLTLLTPPPFVIHKSDIPKNKKARANWIKRIKMFKVLMIPEIYSEQINKRQLKGLALMLSKSSDFSYKFINNRRIGAISYLSASKRIPGKNTDYKKFFKKVRTHYKENIKTEIHQNKLLEMKINEYIEMKDGVIHEGNLQIKEDCYEIEALTKKDQLELEAMRMNNCVASQYKEAFLKKYVHFHVKIKDKDFTLALTPNSNCIYDFKGFNNEKPSEEDINFIKDKLKAHEKPLQEFLELNKTPVDLGIEI